MKFIDIYNEIKEKFIKNRLKTLEITFFAVSIVFITLLSFYTNDGKIALLYAIFGISYTIFNGKSNIVCYLFGISATLLYSYLTFINGFWGNFGLNIFYYLPVQIFGLINWKKHLINKAIVQKTRLSNIQKKIYYSVSFAIIIILAILVKIFKLSLLNFLDYTILFLSVIAMILAVKRCLEQWYYWITINFLAVIMWLLTYIKGSNCLSILFIWGIYLILGIYFLIRWKADLKGSFK